MKSPRVFASLVVTLLLLTVAAIVRAAAPVAVPGELIVKFKLGASASSRALALARVPASASLHDLPLINAAHVRFSGMSTAEAIAKLREDPFVVYAEPNYEIHLDAIPDDPRFPELYGMHNTGQTGGTPGADIRATLAWDLFTGDPNLKVGVIDTGIDYNHPDLAANIWTNPGEVPGNRIDDDHNGYVDDVHGYDFVNNDGDPMDDHFHGTHVSGTIAGVGNNGVGVAGVNWRCQLVGIKFLSASGGGTTAGAIQAVQYAVAVGVRLTSNSWGGGGFSAGLLDAINAAGAAGQLFVAAAGNAGSDSDVSPQYPAAYDSPYIISVAATDANDQLASFSNWGLVSVDLGAPGVDILSCTPGANYGVLSGTSMATPHVAGAVALVAGRFPAASNLQIKDLLLASTDTIPSLRGRVVTGGRLNVFRAIQSPDSIAPGTIGDLLADTPGSTAMGLSWTASGDDGADGRAAQYDLRYSTAPIDESNFATALRASTPAPHVAGTHEVFEVSGLDYNTLYYFALKAVDEMGNASEISNLATGTTLGVPHIAIAPTSFTQALLTGEQASQTLTVFNTGEGRLDFNAPTPGQLLTQLGTLASTPVNPETYIVKDAADPRPGSMGNHGPDRAGYRWIDSDDPKGPAFDWVDITRAGTPLALMGDDAISAPTEIGFKFPFYGRRFGSVRVCTNGFLTFTGDSPAFANGPLPTAAGPADLVAPLWDDLAAGGPKYVYAYNDGSRFIVTFVGAPSHTAGGGEHTFQVILYPSGEIRYQYLSLGSDRNSATVGIQEATRATGLQVAFNTPYLHDRQTVQFLPLHQWLSVVPESGRVAAGASTDLQVNFDATGMFGGIYLGNVNLDSNDPALPHLAAGAQLAVTGAPDISVVPDSLDFGPVFLTTTRVDSVVVRNVGTDLLSVTGVSVSPGVFSVPGAGFDLPPGSSQTLAVTFTPTSPGAITGSLLVASNDHDEPVVTVPLFAEALVPPDVSIAPDSLTADLFTGEQAMRTMTITNSGGSPLVFALSAIRAAGAHTPLSSTPVAIPDSLRRPTPNQSPQNAGAPTPQGTYAGTHLQFGITAYGEVMPYQFPVGNEHLALGARLAGYTLAYEAFGVDHSAYAVNDSRSGIVPVSYRELENTAARVVVEVVTQTADGLMSIRRLFTFPRDRQYVQVKSTVQNLSAGLVTRVVLKEDADWDVDANFYDTWNYDRDRNMVFASNVHYVAIAAEQTPAAMDINGWNDYYSRSTTVEFPVGPVFGYDGLEVLHFELGSLAPLQSTDVKVAYGAGNSLEDLQRVMDEAVSHVPWLTFSPLEGSVPAGSSQDVIATFDASGLFGGDYRADIHVSSNDPDELDLAMPTHLHVTGAPDIAAIPDTLEFGSLFVGATRMDSVEVRNTGTDVLSVTSVTTAPATFTAPGATFSLAPGEGRVLPVSFAPTSPGTITGGLFLASNDPDEPIVTVFLRGQALVPPDVSIAPDSLTADLFTGEQTTRTMTITNSGGSPLEFALSALRTGGPHAAQSHTPVPVPDALRGPTLNQSPHVGGPTAQAIYQGTYLQFGITGFGEVMPYQFPVGNEHLALGTPLSGYTLAYEAGGVDHVAFSVNDQHFGIVPVSYNELENTPARVVVEVVTQTADGLMSIRRLFTFPRDRQYVQVQSTVQNLTAGPVNRVVLKEDADWDADGNFNNTWDYDRDRNMVFASNVHYVGIAAEQTPDLMDLYGWNDFATRTTIVDFPVGPVFGFDGLEVLHFELGTLAAHESRNVKLAYGAGNTLAQLQSVMDDAVSRVPWLRFSPTAGSVPAGSSQDIIATFDATGLFGGDYRADLHVSSNDPDEPDLAMPTHLHVTGAPDIAVTPDSLDFGTQFVGVTREDSLFIRNAGTDVLTVTSVTATPADFTVPGAGFSLTPGEGRILLVAFSPATPTVLTGTLVVASDDPDEPAVTVYLSGTGLVPPDISLVPDSLTADLLTGEQTTRTMTITNSGGSDLVFHVFTGPAATSTAPVAVAHEAIQRRPGPPLAGASLAALDVQPLSLAIRRSEISAGGRILVIADGGTQGDVDSVLSAAGYVVTEVPDDSMWNGTNPSPLGFGAVVLLDGPGVASDMPMAGQLALMDYVNSGGGLILTEWSAYEVASGRYAFMHPLVPLTWGGYADGFFTYNVVQDHPVTSGVSPSFNVSSAADLGYLNSGTAVVTNSTGSPMVIVKDQGAGHIVHFAAGGNYGGFHPFAAPNMQRLLVNSADWVSGQQWLRFNPSAGTVPAGTSLDVIATFDAARLFGGDYRASVHVGSNDPDESDLSIPAHLHVTGAPDIAVTPDSLDFGSLFVGATRVDSVVVKNVGTDLLSVSSVAASPSDYSAPGAGFDLAPGASRRILVTFAPASAGAIPGSLLITSNDPDEGGVTVRMTGVGLLAPDIAVSPDSLVANLLTNEIATRTLTILNAGGSDLAWTAEVGSSGASSVLSSSPVFGASKPAPDKTVLTAPPPATPADQLYSSPIGVKRPAFSASTSGPVVAAGSLSEALANLDAGYSEVTAAIPNRFDFFEGETGNSIGDGGNDMYDGGNFLSTELSGALPYSNGVIMPSPAFGPGGQYFTRKYPGLFVLVADQQGVNSFAINGNLGADGSGNVDGSVLQLTSGGTTYRAFIKRVFNAGDPSVNHMVIVSGDSTSGHFFSTNTNDDQHTVYGLGNIHRIYYLLYAGQGGGYINDASAQQILAAFLHALRPAPLWLTVTPTSGVTAPGQSTNLEVRFNATGLLGGDYRSAVLIHSNDPDESEVVTPAHMHVTGAPDIVVAPDHLDFGTLFTGATRVDSIQVLNVGSDLLTVTGITASPGAYQVPAGGFALAPGASQKVPVTFAPTSPGVFPGLLSVSSNDPTSPIVGVTLSGTALAAPVISVTPDSMAFNLLAGTQGHAALTVHNGGGSPLTFRIGAERIDGGGASPASAAAPVQKEVTLTRGDPVPERRRAASPSSEPLKLTIASRVAVSGGSVLVIGDGGTEVDVQSILAAGGYSVTIVADDGIWNGTNPSPGGFGAVVLLDGINYGSDMPTSGQQALVDYVNHGGGLFVSEWIGFEVGEGRYTTLAPILPFVRTSGEESTTNYTVMAAHPVTAGLSPTFTVTAGLSTGTLVSGVVLVQHSSGSPAVVAGGYGSGHIVSCAFAGNYGGHRPFMGPDMQRLMLNAADWVSGAAWLSVNPTEGTVAPGQDMVMTVTADATMLLGGTYRGQLRVANNDPVRPEVIVPVSLTVGGVPDILAAIDSVAFGPISVGTTEVESLTVSNVGTGLLVVSSVVTSPAYFTSPAAGFVLSPGQSRAIPITFAPTRSGTHDGTIVFYTNDLDSRAYLVKLEGEALGSSLVVTAPDALHPMMRPDEVLLNAMTIQNRSESALDWNLNVELPGSALVVDHQAAYTSPSTVPIPKDAATSSGASAPVLRWSPPPARLAALAGAAAASMTSALAELYPQARVLSELNEKFASVTSRIPSRFNFIEGEISTSTPDGGSDMFDEGNVLATDRGGPIPYSNNVIVNSAAFGGNCFTRKYPGLFVLSADLSAVQRFTINGNLGADGAGAVDGAVLELTRGGRHYRGFVKRVFSAGDPSVNHLVIVADASAAGHTFSGNTDLDLHEVTGLGGASRLYYLLFASEAGGYIDDAAMLSIMTGFLDVVDPSVSWLVASPSSGTLPAHGSANISVRFDSHGMGLGGYLAQLSIRSNDAVLPLAGVPVSLLVSTTAAVGDQGSVSFALHGVIPNPPVRELMVSFSLPDAQPATLDLLDLAGRRIQTVDVGSQGAGRHSISLGRSGALPSGIYMVRLQRAGHSFVSKCLIVR